MSDVENCVSLISTVLDFSKRESTIDAPTEREEKIEGVAHAADKSFLQETPLDALLRYEKLPIPDFARQIDLRLHAPIIKLSEVTRLAAHANRVYTPGEKKQLIETLGIKKSYFSRLARIGSDERLHKESVLSRLPASPSALYKYTKYTDEELAAALNSPARTKEPSNSSVGRKRGPVWSHPVPEGIDRGLYFTGNATPEQVQAVDAVLNQLETDYPVAIVSCSARGMGRVIALREKHPRNPNPLDAC